MPHIRDIQIRDPFVLTEGGIYYLFGSTDKDIWRSPGTGFDVYTGKAGLAEFEGPFPAFRPPEGFWAAINFWAPEVYRYGGAYYMFATFKPNQGRRGTAVLKGQSPLGPFAPWSAGPVTPSGWECLDGTFYQDKEGKPWMIFCHEWVQAGDGEICLIPLRDDLKAAAGEPKLLFRASEAPWAHPLKPDPARNRGPGCYVTDGPNMYATGQGTLLMLWSSFDAEGKYCLGIARSESGLVSGPWTQEKSPLYAADGGHGMLFHSVDGKLYLAVHTPNRSPDERALFVELEEQDGFLSKK
ncbi:MAG: glycoside hydrolase family 43 protein [Treponema sp.]|jgi:GH43 family beta-xylosidase|nr:glycoside hydrolase family 43 protein [Treponema sp.]